MSSLFWFRIQTNQSAASLSTDVVFSGPNKFEVADLEQVIREATRYQAAPDLVYIFLPVEQKKSCQEMQGKYSHVFAPITKFSNVTILLYNSVGSVVKHVPVIGNEGIPDNSFLNRIKRQGLTYIFSRREGLQKAGPTAHFVKPSDGETGDGGDRCFLRASRALSESPEVFFIAFWILPYITAETHSVHIDTSTIGSLVYAAMAMKKASTVPLVRNFQSYKGLKLHRFSKERRDLILISASQTGNMAKKIIEKIGRDSKVITLFQLADIQEAPVSSLDVLCDLTYHINDNPQGFEVSQKLTPKECRDTRPMRIIGEQFWIGHLPPFPIVPKKPYMPKATLEILNKISGGGVFKCHHIDLKNGTKEVWLDVSEIIKTGVFNEWINKVVARHIPAVAKHIVYIEKDPGSKIIADEIKARVRGVNGVDLELISSDALQDNHTGKDLLAVVIVAGAVGHGRSLLSISRALRTWAPNSHRIYLSSAIVPASKRALSLLKSNLRQPKHVVECMLDICLPRNSQKSSWNLEIDFLDELVGDNDGPPDALEMRLKELRNTSTGLENNLFWGSGRSLSQLTLRKNFAFWTLERDCDHISQADVYVTISALLENMRSGDIDNIEDYLVNTPYRHAVLSPEAFTRFNDGIIQAALLRAAHPIELDYRDDPDLSKQMKSLIRDFVEMREKPQGEAAIEFLLALATDKLKLRSEDAKSLQNYLRSIDDKLDNHILRICTFLYQKDV